MGDLTIWTLDRVPECPRGFVRDMRPRWACEEAGIPHSARTVAFDCRETGRPAFSKAHPGQLAHFAAADRDSEKGLHFG